jgi:hypothetical protein
VAAGSGERASNPSHGGTACGMHLERSELICGVGHRPKLRIKLRYVLAGCREIYMRKATSFAAAVAALALTGVSVTGALAGSADAPAIMPIFVLEIVSAVRFFRLTVQCGSQFSQS